MYLLGKKKLIFLGLLITTIGTISFGLIYYINNKHIFIITSLIK